MVMEKRDYVPMNKTEKARIVAKVEERLSKFIVDFSVEVPKEGWYVIPETIENENITEETNKAISDNSQSSENHDYKDAFAEALIALGYSLAARYNSI